MFEFDWQLSNLSIRLYGARVDSMYTIMNGWRHNGGADQTIAQLRCV